MAVKWVLNTSLDPEHKDLVSCSLDKTAILWKYVSEGNYLPYHMRGKLDFSLDTKHIALGLKCELIP
jgi:hypothetical protein